MADGQDQDAMKPVHEDHKDSSSQSHHFSLTEFINSQELSGGHYQIDHGRGLITDILIFDRRATVTVVTFNGAAYNSSPRPYFQMTKMFDEIEAEWGPVNRVHIHDALLRARSDLRIGWYLGTPEVDLARDLNRILNRVLGSLRRGQVFLIGSSAGGFAALTQGEHLPDVTVVAANPQTRLERYEPSLFRKWLERAGWREAGLPLPEPGEITERSGVSPSRGVPGPNQTYFLLNINDDLHNYSHVVPWVRRASSNRKVVAVIGLDWGAGHSPAPREPLKHFLIRLFDSAEGGMEVSDAEPLGILVPVESTEQLIAALDLIRSGAEETETEMVLDEKGVSLSVRDPIPGGRLIINAGVRCTSGRMLKTHLISLHAERHGRAFTGRIENTSYSADDQVEHFKYLQLREGHVRTVFEFAPPEDVAITGVRIFKWVRSREGDAGVFLTDVRILLPATLGEMDNLAEEETGAEKA